MSILIVGAPLIRIRGVVVVLALFAISGLGAMALQRMAAGLHGDLPSGWPASGCLDASVAPWRGALSPQAVDGEASLCIGDGGTHGTLDLEHLEPEARYAEWLAYFESPSLCAFGQLIYQIHNFNRPCTLADLDGSSPHGVVQSLSETAADAQGGLHVAGPIRDISLAPHAQAWLLVSRPSWSPLPGPAQSVAQDTTSEPVARAIFDLP